MLEKFCSHTTKHNIWQVEMFFMQCLLSVTLFCERDEHSVRFVRKGTLFHLNCVCNTLHGCSRRGSPAGEWLILGGTVDCQFPSGINRRETKTYERFIASGVKSCEMPVSRIISYWFRISRFALNSPIVFSFVFCNCRHFLDHFPFRPQYSLRF